VAIEERKTLVTGGSGMVGHAVRKIMPNAIYPSSGELNLLDQSAVENYFKTVRPKAVIHLAAKVGGVKANSEFVGEFYSQNIKMNSNILDASMKFGVPKVISFLSTCVYPDNAQYPLTEDQLHAGPPHISNYGYAYAKRMMEVQSRAYRQQYGCNFICAIPNNLYGENDNFDLENGHVIPALMRRIWESKLENKSQVEVWGDGTPLREFTYSGDIAEILMFLLGEYNGEEPINIGHTEETSIKTLVTMLCEYLEYKGEIVWNTSKPAGQLRKPSSNKRLIQMGWDKTSYLDLKKGLKNTCEWFKINYPNNIRG
jgi:GDP-L-fucose synthase